MLKKGLMVGVVLLLLSTPVFAMETSISAETGYASVTEEVTSPFGGGSITGKGFGFGLAAEVKDLGIEKLSLAGVFSYASYSDFDVTIPAGYSYSSSSYDADLLAKYQVLDAPFSVSLVGGYNLCSVSMKFTTDPDHTSDNQSNWSGFAVGVEGKGKVNDKVSYSLTALHLPSHEGTYHHVTKDAAGQVVYEDKGDVPPYTGYKVGAKIIYALNEKIDLSGNVNFKTLEYSEGGMGVTDSYLNIFLGANYKF